MVYDSNEFEFEYALSTGTTDNSTTCIDFLDIELPDPNHFESSQLCFVSSNKFHCENGVIYEERYDGDIKTERRKLYDEHRTQYIDGKWENNCLVEYYAEFKTNDNNFFRLNGIDNIITSSKNNFVARFKKQPINIKGDNFQKIKNEILSNITIIKVFNDDLINERDHCREKFKQTLIAKQNNVILSKTVKRDLFHLYLLMEDIEIYHDFAEEDKNTFLLNKITNRTNYENVFSQEFKAEAQNLLIVELEICARIKKLSFTQEIKQNYTKVTFSWKEIIKDCINGSLISIRKSLLNALPTQNFIHSGSQDLLKLDDYQVFTCSVEDIKFFSDLEITVSQHLKHGQFHISDFIHLYVDKIWTLLFQKLQFSTRNDLDDKPLYTRPVFLQLFKAFLELLSTVCQKIGTKVLKIISVKENADLFLNEQLKEQVIVQKNQLNFLLSLINHFKPGEIKNNNTFNYKFNCFTEKQNVIKSVCNFVVNKVNNYFFNISEEKIIWLYFIHNSFQDLLCNEETHPKINELISFLNNLMNLFQTVIKSNEISFEKIRILSNSIIHFGIMMTPYILEESIVKKENKSLLLKQAEYIGNFITVGDHSLDDVINIVDVYVDFWIEHNHLCTVLENEYKKSEFNKVGKTKIQKYENIRKLFSSSKNLQENDLIFTKATPGVLVDKLIVKLNTLYLKIFALKVYSNKFLFFLRSYNEFIRLLRSTNFPWYVKEDDLSSENYVELADEVTHCYVVRDTERFLQQYLRKNKIPPKHYLLQIAITLVNCVKIFISSRNQIRNADDKMQASSDLFLLMGRSLINFQKQPQAANFENFFIDFKQPFYHVIRHSKNMDDFKRRLDSLAKYYTYTMDLNEIHITDALKLYKKNVRKLHLEIDYAFDSIRLEECYNIYLIEFNEYIDAHVLKKVKVTDLVEKVTAIATSLDISEWDLNYKTQVLPKILAGLSAVWSILESEDIISIKKVIKPHSIQILCILRLLGVDQECAGFDGHLAQVLTGQGKSLILSLLAAVLTITGNRVRIVCYNEYLVKRDKSTFYNFYEVFGIEKKINYGTFTNMATEILEPKFRDSNYCLEKFVNEFLTGKLPRLFLQENDKLTSKTVLLIDEVDVFFSPEYYGNTFNPCETIRSKTLADLQVCIWNLTVNYDDDVMSRIIMRENIMKFIDNQVLQSTDEKFISIVKFSRNILNIHVNEMIETALRIRKCSANDSKYQKFRMRDEYITTIENNGEYRTDMYYRYDNIFMYFKLKKQYYDHKKFENYGYLNVECGSVSYSKLPRDYRTILGVTGTLKHLFGEELNAVKSYSITRITNVPTLFGEHKLKTKELTIKETVDEWIRSILKNILKIVKEERAVLVFFEDEQSIDLMREKFKRHLAKYSILTGNERSTEVNDCIEEAGVPRKITIAIRRMGRGVDFKSNDSTVESKGGIHVIQTFFSEDIREEMQIKGRTARKDNNGSYEMILCREHLRKLGYSDTENCYRSLSIRRLRRSLDVYIKLSENNRKSQFKHDATIEFLHSFFRYDLKNRNEYFKRYPFVELEQDV